MESLYPAVKEIHVIFRWIILALALITIVKYFMGWINRKPFTPLDDRLSLFYTISLDIQLLLGLALYFFLSPYTQNFMQSGDSALQDPNVRFFAMEHPTVMILGIICAHVGKVVSRKAATDTGKFKRGAIWFSVSLVLILARMPW